MFRIRTLLLSAVFLTAALPQLEARQVSATAADTRPGMTNEDVITLASAGLGDEIVIAKIRAAVAPSFDTSVSGLRALKAAGLSTAVIKAMIDPAAAPSVARLAALPDPDDPETPHSAGIYTTLTGADGKTHLTSLAHVYAKEVKLASTSLVSGEYRAEIAGSHAVLEIGSATPTFYAYLGEDHATAAVVIRDLCLIEYKVKKTEREVTIGHAGYTGSKPGTDKKATLEFTSTEIKPGIYKITLDKPLPAGEFAFYQAGTFQRRGYEQDGGSYFEFGVQPVKP